MLLLAQLIAPTSFASFRCGFLQDTKTTIFFDSSNKGLIKFDSENSLMDCQNFLKHNINGAFYCAGVDNHTLLMTKGGNGVLKFELSNHKNDCQNFIRNNVKGDFYCSTNSASTILMTVSNSRSEGLIKFEKSTHKSDCQSYLSNNISN